MGKVNQVPEDAYYPVKDRQSDPIATHDVYEKLSSCQAASQGLHRAIFLALKLRSMERGALMFVGCVSERSGEGSKRSDFLFSHARTTPVALHLVIC